MKIKFTVNDGHLREQVARYLFPRGYDYTIKYAPGDTGFVVEVTGGDDMDLDWLDKFGIAYNVIERKSSSKLCTCARRDNTEENS